MTPTPADRVIIDYLISHLTTDLSERMAAIRSRSGADGLARPGELGTRRSSTPSNPTETAALGNLRPDPAAACVERLARLLEATAQELGQLARLEADLYRRSFRKTEHPVTLCWNCKRYGVDSLAVPGRGNRDEACYKYWRRNGVEAPRGIVKARLRRRRVA